MTHVVQTTHLIVQVKLHRTTTACCWRHDNLNATSIEHTCRCCVDVGHHGGLHATGQHQDLASMRFLRPRACILRRWYLGLQSGGHESSNTLSQLHGRCKQRRSKSFLEHPTQCALLQWPWHFGINHFAAQINQMTIFNTARTGAFAVATRETAVEMQLCFARGLCPFKHLLHEVDATPRPIQFIAHQLIGRASGRTKSTMHALTQNGLSFFADQSVLKLRCELGLHVEPQKCAFSLRGPKMPAGSNSCFNAC